MVIKNKKETIYPIGFLENPKKTQLFARTKESPKEIFLVLNKKTPTHFSERKEHIIVKNKLFKTTLYPERMDYLSSAHVKGKDIITFLYGIGKNKKLLLASSKNDHVWTVSHGISSIRERGGIVSDYLHKKEYHIAYYGESSIWIAASSHFKNWIKLKEPVLKARSGFFDNGKLKFIASRLCDRGILVFYDASVRDGERMKLQIGAALFSSQDPKKIIWRSDMPIFEATVPYEDDLECKGTSSHGESISFYWYATQQGIFTTSIIIPFSKIPTQKKGKNLVRSELNPIITPQDSWWCSEATLNPAAVNIDGTVHLLFRAMGGDGVSRIGYAKSEDGFSIDEISHEPVFALRYPYIGKKSAKKKYDPVMYPSGGSWGGCEDPRIVEIDGRLYMTFNSFDGWDNMRVSLTSIKTADFLQKNWDWEKPQLLSPGRAKNWLLFPEKIRGKFALLHSIHADTPNHVRVEYFDTLDDIDEKLMQFESPDPQRVPFRQISWHMHMRSATTPPLKTPDGWLVFYHAHHANEMSRYKLGVMLLSLDDPTRVIARSPSPILAPDMWYENDGKPGIVYANGAVIKNNILFVYYGGGDKRVCVATIPLSELLTSLKHSKDAVPTITKVTFS